MPCECGRDVALERMLLFTALSLMLSLALLAQGMSSIAAACIIVGLATQLLLYGDEAYGKPVIQPKRQRIRQKTTPPQDTVTFEPLGSSGSSIPGWEPSAFDVVYYERYGHYPHQR